MRVIVRDTARRWYERWESQQQLYAGDREERFDAVLDAVEAVRARPRVIVDLGSGPGSLAARAAGRFPEATVVAVDQDPFLLELGSAAHPQVEFVQSDIGAPNWASALARHSGRIDAIVSSTALHYPRPDTLAGIYRDCHRLLEPRSILVDADQFYPVDSRWDRMLAATEDVRSHRSRAKRPSENWGQWWAAAAAEPSFSDALARRASEVPVHEKDNNLSIDDHLELMRQAGFVAAGPIWQHGRSAAIAGMTA
ncbi:hypothetical protein BJF84_14225 [Rhodococcus sp. CUA-806]|nr:hypothetical protein BJF84_14225 [Rhodococcus sp. CUA-806]